MEGQNSNENEEVVVDLLRSRMGKLEKENIDFTNEKKELEKKVNNDSLTNLRSRHYFEQKLDYILIKFFEEEHSSERRKKTEGNEDISLILIDIDLFKEINDVFGHLVGNTVLVEVARAIQDSIRDLDVATRWGGDEFAIILVGASAEDAAKKAENIKEKINSIVFNKYSALDGKIKVSIGVASISNVAYISGLRDKESLFEVADKALYKSKRLGRNKVTVHSKTSPDS